jgi:hypothetical protein
MSFHRTVLLAVVGVFAAAFATAAQAQCGGCAAPIAYAAAPVYAGGCGGCGASLPVTYAEPIAAPFVYAQPSCGGCGCGACITVQAVPVAPAPIAVDHWDTGGWVGGCGCGCGGCGCGGCGGAYGYLPIAAASPIYIVNQGPEYSGPGLMRPFGTYSPLTGLANPAAYPYVGPGYARGPYGARYANRHYWHHYGYPHRWRG